MGLFRKLKKVVKKAVKLGIKTAPIWSSFVPGGSIVGRILKSPAGAMGMSVLRQRLKVGTPSPAATNRFPLPNAFANPRHPAVQKAIQIHALGGGGWGPRGSRRGVMMRMRTRAAGRTRQRALRGRYYRRRRMMAV